MTKEMCSQEIDERYGSEPDLQDYLDKEKTSWKKHKETEIDLTVD